MVKSSEQSQGQGKATGAKSDADYLDLSRKGPVAVGEGRYGRAAPCGSAHLISPGKPGRPVPAGGALARRWLGLALLVALLAAPARALGHPSPSVRPSLVHDHPCVPRARVADRLQYVIGTPTSERKIRTRMGSGKSQQRFDFSARQAAAWCVSLGCPALACMTCRARVVDRRRRGIAAQLVNRLARQGGSFFGLLCYFTVGFVRISRLFFLLAGVARQERGRRGSSRPRLPCRCDGVWVF